MTNEIVNFYWEKNMPKNQKRLDQHSSNHEVTEFMTQKYINKKWADDNWSHDPAWLFENKPNKFQKYMQYYREQNGLKSQEPVPQTKSEQKLEIPPQSQPSNDLFDMSSPPKAQQPTQSNSIPMDLFNTQAPPPSSSNDDGFNEFQGTNVTMSGQPSQMT